MYKIKKFKAFQLTVKIIVWNEFIFIGKYIYSRSKINLKF